MQHTDASHCQIASYRCNMSTQHIPHRINASCRNTTLRVGPQLSEYLHRTLRLIRAKLLTGTNAPAAPAASRSLPASDAFESTFPSAPHTTVSLSTLFKVPLPNIKLKRRFCDAKCDGSRQAKPGPMVTGRLFGLRTPAIVSGIGSRCFETTLVSKDRMCCDTRLAPVGVEQRAPAVLALVSDKEIVDRDLRLFGEGGRRLDAWARMDRDSAARS